MTKPRKTLPRTPSKLIRLALRDLSKIEKDPRYTINMSVFHTPKFNGELENICQVCLAGAVMANTLKVPVMEDVGPGRFALDISNPLLALDFFRMGDISMGILYLDIPFPKGMVREYNVPFYENDPKGFKAAMRRLADCFERNGL